MALQPFIDESTIQAKVRDLGQRINRDYQGKHIHLIGALKGAVFFLCDLARHILVPCSIDFIRVSSYEGTKSSGRVRLERDIVQEIGGRHVLLVEDIIDSGTTLRYLIGHLQRRQPASLRVCALLHKPGRIRHAIPIDYTGFELGDEFVVGYGMDLNENHRNLPFIAAYQKE